MTAQDTVTIESIRNAAQRIKGFVHKTPAMTCGTLDRMASEGTRRPLNLIFKCENFQKVGAFKFRGATNSIRSLLEDKSIDKNNLVVITHSSGNHAQALALAAQMNGVVCHVVMPNNAPQVKKDAVRGYGAIVTECTPTLQAREETVEEIRKGLSELDPNVSVEFISPYDDVRVISGQGTLALELIEQAGELGKPIDVLLAPVGGGGMLSGCATAVKGVNPTIKVYAAEPEGANDAYKSFYSKTFHPSTAPNTIADGLLTSLGNNTYPLILKHVDEIYTVSDEQIIRATKLVWERMKIVIEPSAAVPLAVALFSEAFKSSLDQTSEPLNVGIVFSGGNADILKLAQLFQTV